jgi:hypothetical protein
MIIAAGLHFLGNREQGTGNREQEMERIFPITND